jgi:hypothetical protein
LSGELGGKHPFEKWRRLREPENKLVRKEVDANDERWLTTFRNVSSGGICY